MTTQYKYENGQYLELTPQEITDLNNSKIQSVGVLTTIQDHGSCSSCIEVTQAAEPADVVVEDAGVRWKIILAKDKQQITYNIEDTLSTQLWQYCQMTMYKKKESGETIASITTLINSDKEKYFEYAERPDEQYARNRHKITELFELCFQLGKKLEDLEARVTILEGYHP